MLEAVLIAIQYFWALLEKAYSVVDEVVEIERAVLGKRNLIKTIDLPAYLIEIAIMVRVEIFRRDQFLLGAANGIEHASRSKFFIIKL